MKVPSSSRKRYLGGADWCVAALRQGTLETTGRPITFHVAVFIAGRLDPARLQGRFQDYCARFPLLWGRAARCWCLAPYWKSPADSAERKAPFRHVADGDAATPAAVARRIEELANDPDRLRGCAVALEFLQDAAAAGALVFSFDHLLFDAAGAERFIDLFCQFADGRAADAEFPDPQAPEPAHLDQWSKRFASGRQLNRSLRELLPGATANLELPANARRRPFRFRVLSLTAEETRRAQEQAFATAGYLMFTPYVLATAAATFQPRFARRVAPNADFIVTVSTSRLRPPGERAPHVFFNDLSFLYFGFPVAEAGERDKLARTLRDQMIAQVKAGMPAAVEDSNLLMRILPPRAFWKFMFTFFRNRLSSFALTCLGDPLLKTNSVLGGTIRTHVHFPVIPVPPGLGLILNRSGDVYHVVLSYLEGVLSEGKVATLLDEFRQRLLNGASPEP